jgi:hypothetical protein
MFKRGGFASYTKTGRKMQYGTAVGKVIARGTSSSEEHGICGYMLYIILTFILINQIIQAVNKYQAQ